MESNFEMIPMHRSLTGGFFVRIEVHPEDVRLYGRPPESNMYRNVLDAFGGPIVARPLCKIFLLKSRCIVQEGEWDMEAVPVEKSDIYQLMLDVYSNINDVFRSEYYQFAKAKIEDGKVFRHKKQLIDNVPDLDAFFQGYLAGMVKSLKAHGYLETKARDVGRVMISRAGGLIKGNKGRHRFAAAQIAGVGSVPLEISAIHKAFAERHGLIQAGKIHVGKLIQAMQSVGNRVRLQAVR